MANQSSTIDTAKFISASRVGESSDIPLTAAGAGELGRPAYIPTADGCATVGVVNSRLNLALAIRYDTRKFTRCANWQHWGKGEYVAALEPSTGSVEGRAKDREYGLLRTLEAGGRRTYSYEIEVGSGAQAVEKLRGLNGG